MRISDWSSDVCSSDLSLGSVLSADYSQIELRVMAHVSGDDNLRQAFADGQDIHRATASEVFGTPLDAVTQEQRRAAKAIKFGLIRSADRRVGTECVSTCISRCSPFF